MQRRFAAALLIAIVPLTGLVHAGEAVDAATQAEELVAQQQYVEALAAADAARDAIWNASPLIFRNAVFVASDPTGFGIYEARRSSIFKKPEPLIIYAEPMGYAFGRDGELFVVDMGLDFIIKDKDGNEVAKQEGFASFTLRSRVPNKEFMAKLNYDFASLPSGDYAVTTVAHDKNSDKSGEFTLEFSLAD